VQQIRFGNLCIARSRSKTDPNRHWPVAGLDQFGGAAERLHGTLAVLQLDSTCARCVEGFCVFRKRGNRFLKVIFGFFPVLLSISFTPKLNSFWAASGRLLRYCGARVSPSRLGHFTCMFSVIWSTVLPPIQSDRCRCLDVGAAYLHPITPAGYAVERRTAFPSVVRVSTMPHMENQSYTHCRRRRWALLVTDANGDCGESTEVPVS